jgi:hypothetical protein
MDREQNKNTKKTEISSSKDIFKQTMSSMHSKYIYR